MDVSIVIRTKDEADFIGDTLARISEQDFCGKYEVVIVDSGSSDGTLDAVKKYDVRPISIDSRKFTYGRALNIGAECSNGEFIVNLSAHALPVDGSWLTNLLSGFGDHSTAGTYGRQLSNGHLNPFEALKNDQFFGEEALRFSMKQDKMLKGIRFSNSNSAIRKQTWRRFRFDEHLPWAEDMLWQQEVIENGFSVIYVPSAAVYHTHKVCVRDAYKDSKHCAYALASMTGKRQAIPLIAYDVAILTGSMPNAMWQNLKYIWQNNYLRHLKITPLYVLCVWFGWLLGRAEYRTKR